MTNPAPGGGNSSASWAQVEVHAPITSFSFGKPKTYNFGGWLLLPADFNHDSVLDLVGQSGLDLVLYDGKTNGAFRFQSIAGHFYDGAMGGAFGDFNGDGLLDLAYVAGANPGVPAPQANIVLGQGNGQFGVGSQIKGNRIFQYVAAGDLNGDGKLDLVLSSGRALHVYLGNGDGTFTHLKDYAYEALDLVLGDFNGDGKLDVAAVSSLSSSGFVIDLFYGKGDGTFQTPQIAASLSGAGVCGYQNFLQVSDFNDDGNPDLAVCTDSQIGIVLGNGNGTFQQPIFVSAGSLSQFTFSVGDVNADGKSDLLVSQYSDYNNPQFVVFLGNGDGTFGSQQAVNLQPTPAAALGFTVGDFKASGTVGVAVPSNLQMLIFEQSGPFSSQKEREDFMGKIANPASPLAPWIAAALMLFAAAYPCQSQAPGAVGGNVGIYNGGLSFSSAYIDATPWYNALSTPDICVAINNILTSTGSQGYSTLYPDGAVIDARGLLIPRRVTATAMHRQSLRKCWRL